MSKLSVLIAGCGDVGSLVATELVKQGDEVYGLRRDVSALPPSVKPIVANLHNPTSLEGLPRCDLLIYAAAAGGQSQQQYRATYVEGLRALLNALPQPPKQLLFTSSTAVYGQNDHSWVDEQSPTEPIGFNGRLMLEAEQVALQAGCAATVVRFSGIYGGSRNYFLRQVMAGKGAALEPLYYSNRIHREDCAGVLLHLIQRFKEGLPLAPCYLASDSDPAPLGEVAEWLAGQLGVVLTDRSALHRAGSKRCSNKALRELGYSFRYPSYRDGYLEMISELSQQPS